jgi:hypothetical protein
VDSGQWTVDSGQWTVDSWACDYYYSIFELILLEDTPGIYQLTRIDRGWHVKVVTLAKGRNPVSIRQRITIRSISSRFALPIVGK